MKRGILIALLVPAVAFGAPRKKKKKAKAEAKYGQQLGLKATT